MAGESKNGAIETDPSRAWADRLMNGMLLMYLAALIIAATVILFVDGRSQVIAMALLACVVLWGLEYVECRNVPATAPFNALPGHLIPIALILFATLIVSFPTLNSYFSGDEFAYIPLFQHLSLSQFFALFHTDLSQGVLGWAPHELRPLYGLSYRFSYLLWGLHPLGYHLTGVVVHTINAAMVFFIVKQLAPGDSWTAGFAGLLFAVQPIHSWTISWANGSLTEAVPSSFYLAAFLCFVLYRASGRLRYFAISVVAFAACLMSKETAVTLPILLVAYDLFRMFVGEKMNAGKAENGPRKAWKSVALASIPYIALLLGYLELRRTAFTSYLHEDQWASHVPEAAASPAGFGMRLAHVLHHIADVQAFNIRQLVLPLPNVEQGIVLGIYVVSAIALLRLLSTARLSIQLILFFSAVWYLVTNLPLLVVYQDPHHLYLPSVGACIASAFLIAPVSTRPGRNTGFVRLLSALLLVVFCALQLWTEDMQWARKAEVSQRGTAQLATALESTPPQSLVIVWFPNESSPTESWDENLPYSLQQPFQSADLYSRAAIIEDPDIYCCPLDHWWTKTKPMLERASAGDPDGPVEISQFVWDQGTTSFQVTTQSLPRKVLQVNLAEFLNQPADQEELLSYDQAKALVARLARLNAKSP